MDNTLERFQIVGLHGNKNIDARLEENTLILVGENGSGKTTFLRILFHFLSGNLHLLVEYKFDRIIATIGGINYEINRKELIDKHKIFDPHSFLNLPAEAIEMIIFLSKTGRVDKANFELHRICDKFGIPYDYASRQFEILLSESLEDSSQKLRRKEFIRLSDQIKKAANAQVLYLPTYRRIERELGSIFEGADLDSFRHRKGGLRPFESRVGHIELVEFGMKDVQTAIDRTLGSLKEFARESLNKLTLGYLGDVVNEEYQKVGMKEIADVSEDTVRGVLNRIDESILTNEHKEHVFEVINSARSDTSHNEHRKIISHYFLKLLSFQALLQDKEKPISDFCELCSEYIFDKQFIYDSTKFNFFIVHKEENESSKKIELSDLSSGEKQIVSLFSHLYLSGLKNYFILIDEPELSLSVTWQRRFLTDIRKGGFCAGLVAATHSPFIYDNELQSYAHSMGEFVSE